MPPPVVLGIDGGGSKTLLAVVGRDGGVVAVWRGGGTNPTDGPGWRDTLRDLIVDNREHGTLEAAAIGLSGLGVLRGLGIEPDFSDLLPCPVTLHTDVQVAYDGAFQDRPGVLMLAGTGSIAWAQPASGPPIRVGGWGPIGDEGSAAWIGQQAIALATQSLDGRAEAAPLAAAICSETGVTPHGTATALLRWVQTQQHPRAAVAGLARRVCALADEGEPIAAALVGRAADELASHVTTARRRAGADLPWSHAGSLFDSRAIQSAMAARVGPPCPPRLPPVGGAVWRAARLAGWTCDETWIARLAANLSS